MLILKRKIIYLLITFCDFSYCESKIYAANEGAKSVITIRKLWKDFDYSEADNPSDLYNDNLGAVD